MSALCVHCGLPANVGWHPVNRFTPRVAGFTDYCDGPIYDMAEPIRCEEHESEEHLAGDGLHREVEHPSSVGLLTSPAANFEERGTGYE